MPLEVKLKYAAVLNGMLLAERPNQTWFCCYVLGGISVLEGTKKYAYLEGNTHRSPTNVNVVMKKNG